ncbi:sulfotransferase [Gammaproteobacteria bacterium]|nr:sulfotransferase [Gammaproteobacteria bacterium]
MNPDSTERILIVVGAARSGTSMLRNVIAKHPEVCCVPYDVNYLWRLGNEKLDHDELDRSLLSEATRNKIRDAISVFREPGHCLAEKTVSNALRIPFVTAVYPEARLVHIVRNGYDVIESVRRQWVAPFEYKRVLIKAAGFPWRSSFRYALGYVAGHIKRRVASRYSAGGTWGPRYRGIDEDLSTKSLLEVCALQWQRCVQAATRDLSRTSGSQHITLHYEEFISDPGRHLERIADLLDIDPSAYVSGDVTAGVNCHNVGTGEHGLSATDKITVEPIVEPVMSLLGYEKVAASR